MTRKAVEHLVSIGHRKIAYLGFPHNEGFVQALRAGFYEAHSRLLGTDHDPYYIGEFEDEVGQNAIQIAKWLALPEDRRPTGFAIGAGNKAWQALELCLAQIGRKLSDLPKSISAAGITSTPFTLMFGDARVYQAIEIDNLARFVTPALIHALDPKRESSQIHRFRPELTQARTLGINVSGPLTATAPSNREVE
jgi:DNA-binding LacI/PurR family transcriptional regulator